MGIVTGGASKSALTLHETRGSAKPIGGARDLKFILVPEAGSLVKVKNKIAQRLTRLVGERCAIEARDRIGQTEACRFEVALHAYLDLPISVEMRWVNDCLPYFLHLSCGLRQVDVLSTRPMAPLTIDTFR